MLRPRCQQGREGGRLPCSKRKLPAKSSQQQLLLQAEESNKVEGGMSELSDEASESELLSHSLSMWHGVGQVLCWEELDVPLDLHTASSIGQYEVVQACIQRGDMDLNKRNCGGWTPLMYASYIGHDNIVHLLLEAGVNVNIPTLEGQTPLMLASSCGNESVAYFLLQQGAELEMKDIHGWTALFHCTSAGHQQMVKFLLENGANANCKEPVYGYTPLMEAAASGHEIIVQYLLNHGVKADVRDNTGATARTLAMKYGHTKIVGLIDLHAAPVPKVFCRGPGNYEELSSSDESCSAPQRQRPARRTKGPSIHEGPQALAKITAVGIGGRRQFCHDAEGVTFSAGPSTVNSHPNVGSPSLAHTARPPPLGYVTFNNCGSCEMRVFRYRDVTSPINELDLETSSSRDDSALSSSSLGTLRSDSSSSSEYLFRIPGVSSEGSLESNEDSDHTNSPPSRKQAKSFKIKTRYSNSDSQWSHCMGRPGGCSQHLVLPKPPAYTGPKDLATFLEEIGCLKYLQVFEEQDVDLRIFLTLTESDLKEIGITLFGPKRKMTSAIARWHSSARPPSDALELAYADRLEAEMQELAIQLHKRCQEVQVMKGQVCQEQKLRAVAESCLMERDETWNTIQCRLREAQAITKDAGVLLDQIKSCQAELSSRLAPAGDGAPDTQEQHGTGESQRPGERPVLEGWPPSLKSLSLPELSAVLEKCVGEMGKALQTVTQNLQRLQALGQSGQSWPKP
ncbi:ankyrin repeat and SAM domain-containing protein 3 isoform X1 [Poecile atricapillus]|uniref:ankyrin repeat and SAM domain-containing protein 3 isoform X1 n=2 Tax=Poecile atricapillus TaxID=48891 RepID=UPI002739DCCD|nr:ankyrin repeat and SAM domain-containing protein 3 isoform X1 [Poecile atricapillus]